MQKCPSPQVSRFPFQSGQVDLEALEGLEGRDRPTALAVHRHLMEAPGLTELKGTRQPLARCPPTAVHPRLLDLSKSSAGQYMRRKEKADSPEAMAVEPMVGPLRENRCMARVAAFLVGREAAATIPPKEVVEAAALTVRMETMGHRQHIITTM